MKPPDGSSRDTGGNGGANKSESAYGPKVVEENVFTNEITRGEDNWRQKDVEEKHGVKGKRL